MLWDAFKAAMRVIIIAGTAHMKKMRQLQREHEDSMDRNIEQEIKIDISEIDEIYTQ